MTRARPTDGKRRSGEMTALRARVVLRLIAALPLVAADAAAEPAHDAPQAPARVDLFPRAVLSEDASPASAGEKRAAAPRTPGAATVAGEPGDVAPDWRDAERRIVERFHPSAALVGKGSRVAAAGAQVIGARPAGAPGAAMPLVPVDEHINDQILASQEAADQPAASGWLVAEVEVAVDAAGRLESARVVGSSGRAAVDDAALDAVGGAFAGSPVRDPRGPSVARFSVAAARAVRVPRVSPVHMTGGRVIGIKPQLPFAFDESTGKTSVKLPFTQEVRTRVTLTAITHSDEHAATPARAP